MPTDPLKFQDRLLADERVLWTGSPRGGPQFTARDVWLVPFSIVWCAFAIFWSFNAARANAPTFMRFWGFMFVGLGFFATVGRFFADAWFRSRTSYAVTTQRLLIMRDAPFQSFTCVSLLRIPHIQLKESADGTGTLRFGPEQPAFGNGGAAAWIPSLDPTPQFFRVPEARKVMDLILSVARKAGTQPAA